MWTPVVKEFRISQLQLQSSLCTAIVRLEPRNQTDYIMLLRRSPLKGARMMAGERAGIAQSV